MDGIPFIAPPHTTQTITLQSLYHELNELSGKEAKTVYSEHASTARQIEICSRLVCQGIQSPFPNTAAALLLFYKALRGFITIELNRANHTFLL